MTVLKISLRPKINIYLVKWLIQIVKIYFSQPCRPYRLYSNQPNTSQVILDLLSSYLVDVHVVRRIE